MSDFPFLVRVLGYCPACGQDRLFVHKGNGPLMCHHQGCPEPTAAHDILGDRETQHVATIGVSDFTLRHPLIERIGDRLVDCKVHQMLVDLGPLPPEPGVYRITYLG